ncbi:swarming motility protein ybia [Stylonychia lemnae]|uniref:Swarming motility protein ybia n=1 Tax=Stylonychia lemnae TaxID=5949 RepID=A0A078A0P1_STYLE|nr:swarming motility protein ybia [Stylonychia lemnae]|eukprot:CDW75023.1 swarming motility protein ybia [Stylonychia lemnae]
MEEQSEIKFVESKTKVGAEETKDLKINSETVNFYDDNCQETGWLTNYWPSPIQANDKYYPTSEHYFQSVKFTDPEYSEKIRLASTPDEAKIFGQNRTQPIQADWGNRRIEVMKDALRYKFHQNLELQEKLLSLSGKNIVEHTEDDSFWGDGGDSTGQNMLGKLLMEVRDELSQLKKL